MSQNEITESKSAIDETGKPENFGWARSTIINYNRNLIKTPQVSISESDRYILISPTHLLLFEILDDGYLGYIFMSLVSFKDKKRSSQTFVTPFSLGSFSLPGDSNSGSIKLKKKKALFNFASMDGGARIIKVDIPKFSHRYGLRGEVVLSPFPGAESMLTNMPWRAEREPFLLLRRSPCFYAEGVIQSGISEIVFSRGNSWGILDWSRGVRPHSDLRFWAAGCGQVGERQAGLCVGYNTADSQAGTENAFFLDGKLHKLDKVSFHMPSERLMPWRFTSNDNRLEMTFVPQQERDENHQMFFYSHKRRQLFGTFRGQVILDDGSLFAFQNIAGIAERRKSRL